MRGSSSILAIVGAAVVGCTSPPSGLEPVTGFELKRYLGAWYEIARLDHRFERGLTHVTAAYAARSDGRIAVRNRGYDPAARKWREVRGTARLRGPSHVGSLEVTFFWPFWGGYHIIALDRGHYRYAMVCGSSRSYLWILSREPTMAADVRADLTAKARGWGFSIDKLIFVRHDPPVAGSR